MLLIKKCFNDSFLKLAATFTLFLIVSCAPYPEGASPSPDTILITDVPVLTAELDEEDTYEYDCHRSQFWFCPPLNAVWQMEVIVDICQNPPAVISVGECLEYFECDPSIFLQGEEDCTTEEGYPGTQNLYCNKGKYEYGECISPCFEEICDYVDNDCDGETDEGQTNSCGGCGFPPEEICNDVDDDCDGETDEELVETCSTACDSGYQVCISGAWSNCTAIDPEEEVCNGVDDDCDGSIDEGLLCKCPPEFIGTLLPCNENPLTCGQGFKTCECLDPLCTTTGMTECFAPCVFLPVGDEVCDPVLGYPEEEICNNFDDDCDDDIDEDLYTECYTGPEGTLDIGICHGGEITCVEGSWGSETSDGFIPNLCIGETTPEEEICNGADDDCDGITDYGEPMDPTDILLIVDMSGSMDLELSAVLTALQTFALYYTDETTLQWGLIVGPTTDNPGMFSNEYLNLFSNLSSFSQFMGALAAAANLSVSGGKEMLLDALYLSILPLSNNPPHPLEDLSWKSGVLSTPEIPNFSPAWRETAKRVIILFTDEEPQSFLVPQLSEQAVSNTLSTVLDLKFYTFTTESSKNDWSNLSQVTGGGWFKLSINPEGMLADLLQILDENVCE